MERLVEEDAERRKRVDERNERRREKMVTLVEE